MPTGSTDDRDSDTVWLLLRAASGLSPEENYRGACWCRFQVCLYILRSGNCSFLKDTGLTP